MYLPTPVLLIYRGVLFVHEFPNAASSKISFAAVIRSVCGASPIAEILGFVNRGKTETSPMVQNINYFWSTIMLLVSVTVSGLLARSTYVSLAVTVFNSYPPSFILIFLTLLTSLCDFSSFSLVNIAFVFSLCELDA